jgi:2-methylcitrate dehydratase PrpD
MNLNDKVIRFAADLQWDDIPKTVQHQARRGLLDALGALLAGLHTPVGRLMAEFAVEQFGGNDAWILASGQSCSAVGAALANGFAGNALDIDDGYRLIKGHPGAAVLPAVITAAQMTPSASGRDLLTSLIIGYELGIRAGLIRHATYTTYHASGSWGAVAGAAAAGRLLGFDAKTMREAMGAAEYHAPIAPMMKGIDRPAMVKDALGWGAMVAVASALMAAKGFTGIQPLFAEAPEPEWIEELGREYRMLGLYFKPYAACRWAQPAVAGALKLVDAHNVTAVEIDRIIVSTFTEAARLSCAPPKDTEEAQYNLAFPVAAALLDGKVGPAQVLPPRIFDQDVLKLAGRVETEIVPEFDREFPGRALADVIVVKINGESLQSGPVPAKWEPPDSPTDEELVEKFQWLAGPVLGEECAHQLAAAIFELDSLETLTSFWALLRGNPVTAA